MKPQGLPHPSPTTAEAVDGYAVVSSLEQSVKTNAMCCAGCFLRLASQPVMGYDPGPAISPSPKRMAEILYLEFSI